MIPLSEVTYSRDTTVAAVRDYYIFLTRMYLDKTLIKEPPKGGWPSITPESMRGLGKTNEVISLLRHLPYIDSPRSDSGPNVLPDCMFADWKARVEEQEDGFQHGSDASEVARMSSEGAGNYENVPSHVIGLTWDSEERYSFLLDTRLGIIHWVQCDHHLRYHSSRAPIKDNAYDYAPEHEADTFRDAGTWAIPDFFQVLKEQYQNLSFLPQSSTRVKGIYQSLHVSTVNSEPDSCAISTPHYCPSLFNPLATCNVNIMNIFFHLLNAAALAAAIDFSVIFPTSSPPASSEPEPSICAAENYTNYLIGPRPTGTLSSAMASYTSQLFKTCTLPLEEWLDCPFPESSRLCGFSTAGPSEVMSAYSGFGSLASSWWLTHSLAAEQIASSCPSRCCQTKGDDFIRRMLHSGGHHCSLGWGFKGGINTVNRAQNLRSARSERNRSYRVISSAVEARQADNICYSNHGNLDAVLGKMTVKAPARVLDRQRWHSHEESCNGGTATRLILPRLDHGGTFIEVLLLIYETSSFQRAPVTLFLYSAGCTGRLHGQTTVASATDGACFDTNCQVASFDTSIV
ncbi:hypothetical protein MAC_07575 [Metarhizium acridum CQMa 102]|uniref:DUF7735 domain-containing protein n=1 Tax=Metarhizium acridum (strain CQMa 102) TaxID=655827 RepID=E9ECH7_METAQ|nr:uncharacterized protein MAC_07575 [Metarhizium acridum CQMa 102]EFY86354.1 hypothetical protein MAC_07575 [Metarhizium acridum CQMa 102]